MGETPANRVTVTVEDHTGNKQRRARIAADAPVRDLLPALITALELPMTDPSGRPVTYHIAVNGQQIYDGQTLAEAGVVEGAPLTVVPEMTAGAVTAVERGAPLIEWGPLERREMGPPTLASVRECSWAGREITCGMEISALTGLARHVGAYPEQEVGGLLVGRAWRSGRQARVRVSHVLAAAGARGGAACLHFGIEAWLELTLRRRALAQEQVVGWYHSHPGIGVFLSATDRDLHDAHFSAFPWYVAVVADPVQGELGVFAYDGGELTRLRGEPRTPPDPQEHAP